MDSPAGKTETWRTFFQGFKDLQEWPRDQWAIQIINVLECLAYFSILFTTTLWLKKELGFEDATAQFIYGTWIAVISVMGAVGGFLVDSMKLRKAMLIATGINFIGRALTATLAVMVALPVTYQPEFIQTITAPPYLMGVLGTVLFIQGFGQGMMQPLFNGAISRYTSPKTRQAGFNLWYVGMQIGAILALTSIDFFRVDWGFAPIQWVALLVSGIYAIIAMALVKREAQVTEETEAVPAINQSSVKIEKVRVNKPKPWTILFEEIRTKHFWKFIIFLMMILGVRLTFAFPMVISPDYYTRTMGEDVDFGLVNSLNPWIIIVGLIFLVPYAKRIPTYTALLSGTSLAAASLLLLVLPNELRLVFGWSVKQWYMTVNIIQIIIFAVSEMIWSPTLQYYTAKIAPKEREATYLGISLLPTFLSKMFVGFISGIMFPIFLPKNAGTLIEAGTLGYWRSPEAMWVILFAIAATSPILIALFKSVLPEEKKE